MNENVYKEFIAEELNNCVRNELINAIESKKCQSTEVVTHSFNRFNVVIDRINQKVTIQDIIMYDSEEDDYEISIDSFLEVLKN